MQFKYQIGDKTYIQKKLVMGQIDQLIGQLGEVTLPVNSDFISVKTALGKKLYIALAVVLIEEGGSPKREIDEIEEIAQQIQWAIDPETVVEVIENFFDCNPIVSLLERLKGLTIKINDMEGTVNGTGLARQSSSSAKETSPGETKFSGDSAPTNADPSSNIV